MSQDEQMTADERLLAAIPIGWRYELVWISYFKKVLQSRDLEPTERLAILEGFDRSAAFLTPEAVAAIEPASASFMGIVADAFRLDPPNSESGDACFDCLAKWEVFSGLAKLNPSIIDAIKARVGA